MNMTYEVSFKKPEKRIWSQWGVNSFEESRNPPPLSQKQASQIAERYKGEGYETMITKDATYFSL